MKDESKQFNKELTYYAILSVLLEILLFLFVWSWYQNNRGMFDAFIIVFSLPAKTLIVHIFSVWYIKKFSNKYLIKYDSKTLNWWIGTTLVIFSGLVTILPYLIASMFVIKKLKKEQYKQLENNYNLEKIESKSLGKILKIFKVCAFIKLPITLLQLYFSLASICWIIMQIF